MEFKTKNTVVNVLEKEVIIKKTGMFGKETTLEYQYDEVKDAVFTGFTAQIISTEGKNILNSSVPEEYRTDAKRGIVLIRKKLGLPIAEEDKVDIDDCRKIYMLATDNIFANLYNRMASEALNATSYTTNRVLNMHVKMVMEIRKERENLPPDSFEASGTWDKEKVVATVQEWTEQYLSPEKIYNRLVAIFNICLESKERAQEDVLLITDRFYKDYKTIIERSQNLRAAAVSNAKQQYNAKTTEGLGFGIISNNIGSIIAYDMLNTYEKQRQSRVQDGKIADVVKGVSFASIENAFNSIIDLYDNVYKSALVETIEFEFDPQRVALREEEKKRADEEKARKSKEKIEKKYDEKEKVVLQELAKYGKCKPIELWQKSDVLKNDTLMSIQMCLKLLVESEKVIKESDGKESCFYVKQSIKETGVTETDSKSEQNLPYSAADEILKFKNLMNQGIITAEEFEAKKKQLLGL